MLFRSGILAIDHRLDHWLPIADEIRLMAQDGTLDGAAYAPGALSPQAWAERGVSVSGCPYQAARPVKTGPEEVVLSLRGLRVSQDGREVLRDVNADFFRGRIHAIVGPSGSGKSTLAGLAAHRLGCPLFHMDDFFLPPALRTPERYAAPGGNVHYERVEAELLRPLRETGAACFRPFDCRSMDFSAPIRAELTGLALVEGSYALHPALRGWYDRTVFLTCSPGEQQIGRAHV